MCKYINVHSGTRWSRKTTQALIYYTEAIVQNKIKQISFKCFEEFKGIKTRMQISSSS